jgi:hypothetical protein
MGVEMMQMIAVIVAKRILCVLMADGGLQIARGFEGLRVMSCGFL